MKFNKQICLLLPAGVLLCSSCKKDNPTLEFQYSIPLKSCQQILPGKPAGFICFDAVITDNRCPAGGICIWRGYTMISVSLAENDNIHHFRMSLPAYNAPNDTTINGTRIVFKALYPYPASTGRSPLPAEVKAVIAIWK